MTQQDLKMMMTVKQWRKMSAGEFAQMLKYLRRFFV